jgi:peptidoglycan/LPS O-acetylase OafA/YrhL
VKHSIDQLSKVPYRGDLDALRGISVLLVVFYHAFPNIFPGGFIGVDIFFVISGFLITQIILNDLKSQKFSLKDFYSRRIRRLVPPLLAVLMATLVAGWLMLFPDEYSQLGMHLFKSSMFVQNFQLIGELGYFDVESHFKPLLHLWSLSIEEQYYLVWPLLLLVFYKRFKLQVVIGMIVIMSFGFNFIFTHEENTASFFHSASRVWELAVGSMLGISFSDQSLTCQNKNFSRAFFAAGVTSIGLALLVIDGSSNYPGWLGLLPVLGAALVIYARLELNSWGGLVSTGLISYPLYLWHWVVLSFCYIYIGDVPSLYTLVFAVVISVVLAFLTYRYIEKLRYLDSNLVVPALLACLAIVGVTGYFISAREGLPERNHLAYLKETNLEFIRTPAADELCESYVRSIINEEVKFHYCRSEFIDQADIVAIIGDSHAHALFPGVAATAAKNGYSSVLYANSSCPPLIGFRWGRSDEERVKCQNYIRQIMRLVSEDTSIKKVLIATRGPVYIHGEVQGEITKETVLDSLQQRAYPITQSYETYFKGYFNILQLFSEARHIQGIYYFLENPELDILPKQLVPRPFDYWGVSVKEGTVDKNLYELRMKEYRTLARSVTSKFTKAVLIDVEPYLCKGDRCFSYMNGEFLYADDDHFSVFGSHYILGKSQHLIFDFGVD